MSVLNTDEACQLIENVINMCAKGVFNLTKFTSNKKEVLVNITEKKKKKNGEGVKNEELMKGYIPREKALGIHWNVDEDVLMFEIRTIQKPLTRQGLLSTFSSIYDSLGLVSLFILEGRKIIQILCKNEFKWDEEIPEDLRYAWLKRLHSIQELEDCSFHHLLYASKDG